MTDVPTLIARARLEIGDQPHNFQGIYQGDGTTTVVTTPYSPVSATTIVAKKTNLSGTTTLVQGVDYTVDERSGTLTLTAALQTTDTLTVTGTAYRYFTDTDWTTFVNDAVVDHLHNRNDIPNHDITFLGAEEQYPLALLTVVMALYALLNDAAFDINISTPEGVAIPRSQRFEQLQSMLAARIDQYNKWASAFNIGPWRIEQFDLRRVSRTTNRLVPIYTPQEFMDTRFPTEQFPPIDPHGSKLTPVPTVQQVINLTGYSNQAFSYTVSNLGDLTGLSVKASVRRYPQAYTPLAVFKVVVNTLNPGNVTISLDGTMMYYLGTSKFWDLETVDASGNVSTLVAGTFDAIRQGTYG